MNDNQYTFMHSFEIRVNICLHDVFWSLCFFDLYCSLWKDLLYYWKRDTSCEKKVLCSLMQMLCKGFHAIWWWHDLCDSLQWRSPRLAYKGSVVNHHMTHIRRRVEGLNGTNTNWDTRGHHTRFSEANTKEGYLVDYVIFKTNLGGFKTLVAAIIRVNTLWG